MNLFWNRVLAAAVFGFSCISLPAQQTPPTAPTSQTASPSAQPPVASLAGQEAPANPNGSTTPQNPNAPFTLQQTVRLVVLDMVITDSKGNVVTDLKRENFHVEEDGKPQDILNFDLAGAHTIDPQLTVDSTADLDNLRRVRRSTSLCWMSSTRVLKTWRLLATL